MRQLAQTLGAPPARSGRMRIVTVTAITTNPNTVTIAVGGSDVEVEGVRYMASYTPTVGDTAVAWYDAGTVIVIDKLA